MWLIRFGRWSFIYGARYYWSRYYWRGHWTPFVHVQLRWYLR